MAKPKSGSSGSKQKDRFQPRRRREVAEDVLPKDRDTCITIRLSVNLRMANTSYKVSV